MGHASHGNSSPTKPKIGERPDPKAAADTPDKGRNRPGFDLGGANDPSATAGRGIPAAGPHAKRELTQDEATPGAGTLPDPDSDSSDSTSG